MKIYTKKGDKGETRLLYGDAVSKDSIAPEAYGSVDELVAALGLIRYEQKLLPDDREHILRIQRELFVVGAELATSKDNRPKLKPMETLVTDSMVEKLEEEIDHLTEKMEFQIFLLSLVRTVFLLNSIGAGLFPDVLKENVLLGKN